MATPSDKPVRDPLAGGALVAILPMLGALIGLFLDQATAGFLIGLAIGIAAAVAIWLRSRG